MLKRLYYLLLAIILSVVVIGGLTTSVNAASVTYYQTSKADVPIWSSASSKSTKIRVEAYTGTTLKVVGSTVNSSGNTWYRLSDGYWVFSGNVTKHSHSYKGGICTGRNCGYEWGYSVNGHYGYFVVTNSSGAKIWSRPYSNNSTHLWTAGYNSVLYIVGRTSNQEGNVWYRLSDGSWVFSGNVIQRYTVSYSANGGSGAPGGQYAYQGQYMTVSGTKPSRTGYIFQGWSTSSGASSASYKSGGSYRFSYDTTLYAVWKACGHSSYTGGYCNTCGYEYNLKISDHSATYQVTNKDGAKIWSRAYSKNSTHLRTEKYGATFKVTATAKNQEGNTWYRLENGNWVFSGNVTRRYSVTYNANGGKNAPAKQYFLSGQKSKLSGTKPTRVGYLFQGWAESGSAILVKYKPSTSYSLTSSKTLYAVWKACGHSAYTGGYCNACGYEYNLKISDHSATYQVTNKDGAKIWSRSYSKNATHVRTEKYGATFKVTATAKNQEGNTWYRLADGNWVFSGNVIRRFSVTYNANGGKNAPAKQYFLSGQKPKLSGTKPTRVGYVFQGWAESGSAILVKYKPSTSYSLTSSKTLYAVWKACGHSAYTGGYCNACGYEYKLKLSDYSATYQVTNKNGAKIWSRAYSKNATHIRTEKYGAIFKVTAKAKNQEGNTWYRLEDGKWVFSGNVTRRYSVTYNANGGKNAPGKQYFLDGQKPKLTSAKPTRVGYVFQGWADSKSAVLVKYKPSTAYSFSSSRTLYAVWKKCSHKEYVGGYCKACQYEFKLTVTDHSGTYRVTNAKGCSVWSRPYSQNSKYIRLEKYNATVKVVAKTVNQNGSTFYKLSDGYWISANNVTRQYSITYFANGGTGAPAKQYFLKDEKVTLSKVKPVRTGYIFKGWGTSETTKPSAAQAGGASCKFTSSRWLYAVWTKCSNHSYNNKGFCVCNTEQKYTVKATSALVYKVINVNSGTNSANTYTKPFTGYPTGQSVHKGDYIWINGQATVGSVKWLRLKNNTWIPANMVSAASRYENGKLIATDSNYAKNVTTVAAITVSTSNADKYLKDNVGSPAVKNLIPGLRRTVTRTKDGATVTTCGNMVPQGLTFSDDYLLISSYCACGSNHRSVIYVMDKSSKKYLTTLILDDICHVGGLAVQGGYLWVCDSGTTANPEKQLRVYAYSDVKNAVSLSINYWTIDVVATQKVDTTPSYMCSANGYLYVGKFYEKSTTAKIYLYKTTGSKIALKTTFTIEGIKQIQGISVRGNYMIVTASYGRDKTSKVYIFKDDQGFTREKTYDKVSKTWNFPNMIEGCYMGATNTYFVFESAAKEYRYSLGTKPFDKYIGMNTNKLLGK